MSRGTETKSSVVIDKERAPSIEQETVQTNGPGNAALAAQLPPTASAPADGDSPTGPLAGSIHALVADSSVPPAMPRLTGLISVETFGARAVLFHNQGFWTASFGDARLRQGLLAGLTGLDRLQVLQTVVDPQASIHDPNILHQRAVLSARTNPAALRDARKLRWECRVKRNQCATPLLARAAITFTGSRRPHVPQKSCFRRIIRLPA